MESSESEGDVEILWGEFKEKFLLICDKHAPYISGRKKSNPVPWINDEYLSIAHQRDYIKAKFNKTKLESLWNEYKQLRNKANNLNKKLKKEYYNNVFQKIGNSDLKAKWIKGKELLPCKKESNMLKLEMNGKIIDDKCEVSNIFNSYFNCICDKLLDKNKISSNAKSRGTPLSTKHVFKFKEITENFILNELKSLDQNKGYGIDEMHPRLLKTAAELIAKPLASIFNCSVKSGKLPADFKIAKIIPIHKSGTKTDPSNYRPISVLSTVSKIFEKGIHSQLYNYLKEHNLLAQCQSGFRPLHSTHTSLLDVTEYLLANMNSGHMTGAIFLDLRKAFDVIPHDKLLEKLQRFGIRGKEYLWFHSYIIERKQCVSIDGTISNFLTMKSGVPQGSTLGPLLFTMFINDLCTIQFSTSTKLSLYADDTVIFIRGKSVQGIEASLQNQFNLIVDWMNVNDMFINVDKTKIMLFGSRNKIKNKKINIICDKHSLETVSTMKYLGVILDPYLNWSNHVDYIVKKISKTHACLRRIKSYVNQKNLINLYFSLIVPYLDYCCTVWGNKTRTSTQRLQRCQNKYARLVLNADKYTPSSSLLKTLHWQSIQQRIKYQQCIMVYKILNDKVPPYLTPLISNRPVFYHTRYAINSPLFVPTPRTEYMRTAFSYQGSVIFNSLPLALQTCPSLETFITLCRQMSYTFLRFNYNRLLTNQTTLSYLLLNNFLHCFSM